MRFSEEAAAVQQMPILFGYNRSVSAKSHFSVFNFISVQTRDKLVKIEPSMKEIEWSVSKTAVVLLQFV